MKLFKILFLLLLLLNTSIFYAQIQTPNSISNPDIKWDLTQKKFPEGFISSVKILKSDNDYIYYYLKSFKVLIMGFNYNHFLVKYDRKTCDYAFLDITPSKKNKKLEILTADTLDNKFHVYSYFHNKKLKKLFVFDESFDYQTLKPYNDINKFCEIDLTEKGSLLENMFLVSDNNKLLFRYSCEDVKGKYYGLDVFNKKLEREWGSFNMAKTENGYNYESDYKIDNNGNVYAIQRNYERKSDIYKHYDRSRVWVVCYLKDASEPVSTALILKNDLFITAERLAINTKNQVVIAGLYAQPGTESAVGGFSFVLEPNLTKISSVQTNEFTKQLLAKGLDSKKMNEDTKKIVEKKDFEKNFGYRFNDIYFRKDGCFDLVAEKYYSVTVTYKNSSTTYYYFDDLLVLNFNADGSFKWIQKIPKYEYVIDMYSDIGGYYLYHDKNDGMNFIFNIANYVPQFIGYKHKSSTVKLRLDKEGNESFNEMISDSEISCTIVPDYIYLENNDNLIITRANTVKTIMPFMDKYNNIMFGLLKQRN